ncbi:DinB family protein [Bacillus pseudomycoides]|uniref:DinB family protein n=1 Tax=Bacillus pseudomycoides TaxID=64104 RepID=UPI001FB4C3E8|nr:DinB family protein [Bacillus pseudomycoides]
MSKESILKKKLSLIEWCEGLKPVSDEIWFQSFRKGSWGIADVISHFITWDEFLIRHRVPYFIHVESLPNVSKDVEEMNRSAIQYARSGISKEELIDQFIFTRKRLVNYIKRIPDQNFNTYYQFGKESMKLNEYFLILVQHDLKHKEEILYFLEDKQIKLDK